jgi:hypothetical protein
MSTFIRETMKKKHCCASGSGIRCLLNPWIRNPEWLKKSGSRSEIRNEQPGSYFLEFRNHFLRVKILKFLMRIREPGWKKFGSLIRDGKKSDPESG